MSILESMNKNARGVDCLLAQSYIQTSGALVKGEHMAKATAAFGSRINVCSILQTKRQAIICIVLGEITKTVQTLLFQFVIIRDIK